MDITDQLPVQTIDELTAVRMLRAAMRNGGDFHYQSVPRELGSLDVIDRDGEFVSARVSVAPGV